MKELIILVADGTMRAVFAAFFEREHWDRRLCCSDFALWPQEDIFHSPLHTDGGVHRYAHELLRPYLNTHQHAIVVLDQQFGGERPAAEIRADILAKLHGSGWPAERCEVVVIDPELEVWLWQDNPHIAQAINFSGASLRQHLEQTGEWPTDAAKPSDPKATIQALINTQRALKTKVVYSRIARSVSVAGCTDPAFLLFTETLRGWFPPRTGR